MILPTDRESVFEQKVWLKWPLAEFQDPGRYEMNFASYGWGHGSDYTPVVLFTREDPNAPIAVYLTQGFRE